MRKIIAIITVFTLSISICACGASGNTGTDAQTQNQTDAVENNDEKADEAFLNDVVNGLQARWEIAENDGRNVDEYNEEYQTAFKEYINAELAYIEKYADADFKDKELGRNAADYIQALEDMKYALQYVTVDATTYENKVIEPYKTRLFIIKILNDKYDLKFEEKSLFFA